VIFSIIIHNILLSVWRGSKLWWRSTCQQ